MILPHFKETNTLNELKPASEEKRTLSSDDDDEHFKDIHFPPDSALQQVSLIHILLHLFLSSLIVTLVTFSFIVSHFHQLPSSHLARVGGDSQSKGGQSENCSEFQNSTNPTPKLERPIPKVTHSSSL